VPNLSRLGRHALTYFATTGILLLLLAGILLWLLIDKYNDTRKLDIHHVVATFLALALGHTLLITGVVAYLASRKGYPDHPLPDLPKATTVALIPAYNEEKTIANVVKEAKKFVDLVIVVDDGSRDATATVAEEAGAVVVRHPRNMGYGAAVKTLMRAALAADAQYAVLLDADGQHDPTDIPKFLQALKSGADQTASRIQRRRLGYKALALLHRILIAKLSDPFNGYRAFSRKALETPEQDFDPSYGVETEINYQLRKTKTAEISTTVKYHEASSKANPLLQGLNLLWSIVWTALTKRPALTLTLGATSLATSITLFIYALTIFNATRYIRLTYTTLAILLEIVATLLIAIAITSATTRK
jgi:glycosyltransferase involved in cell wall biosynthesis